MCKQLFFSFLTLFSVVNAASAQEVITLTAGEVTAKGIDHGGFIQQPDLFGGITLHFLLFPSRLAIEQKDAIAASGSVLNPERALPGIPKSIGEISIAFIPEAKDCSTGGVRSVSIVMEKSPKFSFSAPSSTINYSFSGGLGGIKAMACAIAEGGGYGMDAQGEANLETGAESIRIAWKVGIAGSLRRLKKG